MKMKRLVLCAIVAFLIMLLFQYPEKAYNHSFKWRRYNKSRTNTATLGNCKSKWR